MAAKEYLNSTVLSDCSIDVKSSKNVQVKRVYAFSQLL